MYDKYDYMIKNVVNKRADGKENPYHRRIIGEKCAVGELEPGYKGCLLIEVFNLEGTPWLNWYYTSLIKSLTSEDSGDLVIETLNSTYILSKIEV